MPAKRKTSRARLSEFVARALFRHDMSYAELTEAFRQHRFSAGKVMTERYLRRKINEQYWTIDDIDILADIFEVEPWQILWLRVELPEDDDNDVSEDEEEELEEYYDDDEEEAEEDEQSRELSEDEDQAD